MTLKLHFTSSYLNTDQIIGKQCLCSLHHFVHRCILRKQVFSNHSILLICDFLSTLFFEVMVNITDSRPHGMKSCDTDSCIQRLPTYTAFSRPGVAVGRPVFINYGQMSDLSKYFDPERICLSDVIVIARYGFGSLATKLRAVMEFCRHKNQHPSAMLVYPDPADVAGEAVFPNGTGLPGDASVYRTASMAQFKGGDPETPYLPAIGKSLSWDGV